MKILIINGSPQEKGTLAGLLHIAQENLKEKNEVEWIDVVYLKFALCKGCMKCRATGSCILPEDDAHRMAEKIRQTDCLIVGTPTYWGNMSGHLKILFDRIVPLLMGETLKGMPLPKQKGKKAIVMATCNTIWPFNRMFSQSSGAVKAVKEILKWSGYQIIGDIQKAGVRKHPALSLKDKKKIWRLTHWLNVHY